MVIQPQGNLQESILDWTSYHIFGAPGQFKNAICAGVPIEDKLIAAVVYNNCYSRPDGKQYMLEMSIASIDKRWCTRHNLKELFRIPFAQLDLERVQTTCNADEGEIIMFNKRLGFTLEGRHRKAWHTGSDALSWGMLRDECRWLK